MTDVQEEFTRSQIRTLADRKIQAKLRIALDFMRDAHENGAKARWPMFAAQLRTAAYLATAAVEMMDEATRRGDAA